MNRQKMNLSELLAVLHLKIDEEQDCLLTGLCQDSRICQPGDVFIARLGTRETQANLQAYVRQAITKGAVAVIADAALQFDFEVVPIIYLENCLDKLGELAAHFYRFPSLQLELIGVTGTNGKSSICHFSAQILTHLGKRVGVLGTIGNGIFPDLIPSMLTSLDPITLQRQLAEFVNNGVEIVLMEVSSHALDQGRVKGCHFKAVAFTNLSCEHLDYHGTMQAYFATKKRLFTDYQTDYRIINCLDAAGCQLADELSSVFPMERFKLLGAEPAITALQPKFKQAEFLQLEAMIPIAKGCLASCFWAGESYAWQTRLYGEFNVENGLLAALCLQSLGYRMAELSELAAILQPPPGRLQVFRDGRKALLIAVDYAHTPAGLAKVLQALRPYTANQLYCVFGCGGDRDRSKRPLMAEAAEQYADCVVVTQDNSRTESHQQIFSDIMAGFKNLAQIRVEADRGTAIDLALASARSGDCVLIAGKGHERVQWIGEIAYPFSDLERVHQYLQQQAVGF